MSNQFTRFKKITAVCLALVLLAGSANAGLTVTRSSGIAATGVDGVSLLNPSGIAATGVDGLLAFSPNGISWLDPSGIAATGVDGIAATGVDGQTYAGTNGIAATGVDGLTVNRAAGIAATGVDGIAVTGVDGQTYTADALIIQQADGIAATGVDGVDLRNTSGIAATGVDSFTAATADGIAATGVDSLTLQNAASATLILPNGSYLSIAPNGIAATGVDGLSMTAAEGIAATGVDHMRPLGEDGILAHLLGDTLGLQSVDPELAHLLDRLTDDSNVNAMVIYHHLPTEADIADLLALGVLGGTRFRALPMLALTTTKAKLLEISRLPAVRSIYGNRTLKLTSDPYMQRNNAGRVAADADLTAHNQGLPVTGRNVRVAVLDTGVDGLHADLSGKVADNVKVLDTLGVSVGFTPPVTIAGLPNTDLVSGHGTFVAGIIAGKGTLSGGRYAGVARGAEIVGVSAGELFLSFVLSGFDYILANAQQLNIRVVNCSFSGGSIFDLNDPVNVATKLLTDNGVNVVFSAGNTGDGLHTLNPYAVAPWVVSVGATDHQGDLAPFSSRGAFGSPLFRPTVVAPGVSLIAPRALGITGIIGLLGADLQRLSLLELPFYTTASGTSFSAPQVAATIAMMLEANPQLTPKQVKEILQRTATPLTNFYQHEVGAGMVNAHAAVLEAAFAVRRMGAWRGSLNRGQVRYTSPPPQTFTGALGFGGVFEKTFTVAEHTLLMSAQIGWELTLNVNHLELSLVAPNGSQTVAPTDLQLLGLTGKRARLLLKNPASGTWRLRVRNKSLVALEAQPFAGAIETTAAEFPQIHDIGSLSATARAEIYQALRTQTMSLFGSLHGANFRPAFAVTRGQLAETMVTSGRVPQYLAAQPRYNDVHDPVTRTFVESAQFSSNTALFLDSGNNFRPQDVADRLTAAVVLVRAAGRRAEAESLIGGIVLGVPDIWSVPASLRGYVGVAVSSGLLPLNNGYFRPANPLTRAELAHALAKLE